MKNKLHITNSLSRKKEIFEPIAHPFVGMYVCGPTVYGDAHLGHARPAVTFDVLYRYLEHLGYKVRYIRNITDVGHLENDADEGEDKITKKARLEKQEPMEVVQFYANSYHKKMDQLNVLPPSIEPHASAHIIEQIEMARRILDNGYAYEKNGSVYFDIIKYNTDHPYGILSGRKVEELLAYTRELEGQQEKKNTFDFALWKKATPEHIMRWPSPWSDGYPGWHLECSAMGAKYLGDRFDIHGGGMDLLFPHHESEIAQSVAANNKMPVKYWLHNNMITINGQKMGKSLGNAVTLEQFFTGDHEILDKPYGPMCIRFFILQAHYRSTLDFSNEALQASGKGLDKLLAAYETLQGLKASGGGSSVDIDGLERECYGAMNDDLNTSVLISRLFEAVRIINSVNDGQLSIDADALDKLKKMYKTFVFDILGLLPGEETKSKDDLSEKLIESMLSLRQQARQKKDYDTADSIRKTLEGLGIILKDTREGVKWELK